MKRYLSVLLTAVLLLSVFFPCRELISREIEKRNVNSFVNRVTELNKEYMPAPDSVDAMYNENNPNAVDNRLIIKGAKQVADENAVASVCGLDYTVLQYDDKQAMELAYDELSEKGYAVQKDRILRVNENYLENMRTSISDLFPEMWAYESTGADYAKAFIEESKGYYKDITVGVLDSGVDYDNEMFDGRITDTSINLSNSGNENDCMDDFGHGTEVAGVIALSTPDNVKIKPYKVVDVSGYVTLSEFTAAVEYIIAEDEKPDILNIGFDGYFIEEKESIEYRLISELAKSGITVCISAGNNNIPVKYSCAAGCDDAITVGAYDYTNHICSFSNYGDEIDIAAPGYEVFSAGYCCQDGQTTFSGTSAAAPFASAACAYILMQNPDYTPARVKERLIAGAIYMGEDNEPYYGNGMINFPNLIDDKTESVPQPDIKGGFYTDTQTVSFSDIPDGTKLIYTLDGSVPGSTNGTVYNEPITIDNEMQLNYALIKDDKYVSNISSQYYTVQYLLDESLFEIDENGVFSLKSDAECRKNNIVVPDTINGIAPLSLNKYAFSNSTLKSIVLPDTVTALGDYSFISCTELKHITAKNVTDIGRNTFDKCLSLLTEVMPNVNTVGANAFRRCPMLHQIDFDRIVSSIGNEAFFFAGLNSVNMPNLVEGDLKGVFRASSLIYATFAELKSLGMEMFDDCMFLRRLEAPKLESLGKWSLKECYMLTEMDFSNLVSVKDSAFYGSYIDTLYAPKLTEVELTEGNGIAYKSFIRVIDLPSLSEIPYLFLKSMFAEELYFENAERMDENSFLNLSMLRKVYMPKTENFAFPDNNSMMPNPGVAPLETIWLPNVKEITGIYGYYDSNKLELFYAPKIAKIKLHCYGNAVIVLSEQAENVDIDLTREAYDDRAFPIVVAPYGSAAEKNANKLYNNGADLIDVRIRRFVDSDSVKAKLSNPQEITYCSENGEELFSVPVEWIENLWNTEDINKTRQQTPYMFTLDLNNDNYINAKDFALLKKADKYNDILPNDNVVEW
ncbi:MAG: S8 family serine peptidase [Eubacterium sp.]